MTKVTITIHNHNYDNDKRPAKLVVVPGAVLRELKVHLLGEDGEPELVRVQLQLQVTPGHGDDDDGNSDYEDYYGCAAPYGKENGGVEGQHRWLVVQRQLHLYV